MAQATKTKMVLSANKEAPFSIETFWDGKDFPKTTIKRDHFEKLLEPMLSRVADPIQQLLEKTNMTLADINAVELIGQAWRVPKVLQTLTDFVEQPIEGRTDKLYLGQHLNAEESPVMGATLVAANTSRTIRPKQKVFFSDSPAYNYTMELIDFEDVPMKNTTTIAAPGVSKFNVKKRITIQDTEKDFSIKLFEDGDLLTTWTVTGVEDAIKEKYWFQTELGQQLLYH